MKVELVIDFEDLPRGTVLQSVEEKGLDYYGLWCSMFGSYYISLPKKLCKVIK